MNIHIERSERWGAIFWAADDQTGTNAMLHAGDPYNLDSIDAEAEERLRRILDITSQENWSAYGIDAQTFASMLSKCFTDLLPSFDPIFRDGPSFKVPQPLREALELEDSVMTVASWIETYPHSE